MMMVHSDMVKSNVKVVLHEKVNNPATYISEASVRAGPTCSCSRLLEPSLVISQCSFAAAEYGLHT